MCVDSGLLLSIIRVLPSTYRSLWMKVTLPWLGPRRNLLQLLVDAGLPFGLPEIFPPALIPTGVPGRITGDGESTGWRNRCMRWSWSRSHRTGCAR